MEREQRLLKVIAIISKCATQITHDAGLAPKTPLPMGIKQVLHPIVGV